jgi:hypothetical protein
MAFMRLLIYARISHTLTMSFLLRAQAFAPNSLFYLFMYGDGAVVVSNKSFAIRMAHKVKISYKTAPFPVNFKLKCKHSLLRKLILTLVGLYWWYSKIFREKTCLVLMSSFKSSKTTV